MRRFMLRLSLLLGLAFCAAAAQAAKPEAILIVMGDQHSAYERTAQFVAHIDRLKRENPGV